LKWLVAALKLERFDKKLLKLLEEKGESNCEELFKEFKIARQDFDKRLQTLAKNKLVYAADGKVVLGIKGFNALEARKKREKKKEKESSGGQEKPQEKQDLTQKPLTTEKPLIETKVFEIPAYARPSQQLVQPQSQAKPGTQEDDERISREVEEAGIMVVSSTPPAPQSKQVEAQMAKINDEWRKADEHCELCKAPFKLSANKNDNMPLYGHCFCGAAYHKDCYEAITDNDGKCVRCGRMLKKVLDKTSVDLLKDLKSAFD
jgi:hypothetical protein